MLTCRLSTLKDPDVTRILQTLKKTLTLNSDFSGVAMNPYNLNMNKMEHLP